MLIMVKVYKVTSGGCQRKNRARIPVSARAVATALASRVIARQADGQPWVIKDYAA
jgi:hypothetical protein